MLEDLKSSVIAFCSICVNRHTDLFMPYFESFSSTIWTTLSDIGKAEASLKYQDVAVASLHFFSSVGSVARRERQVSSKRIFRSVFESSAMITQLIQCVIVPNCMMTAEVSDQFEAQPHLFIKNYEEVALHHALHRRATR